MLSPVETKRQANELRRLRQQSFLRTAQNNVRQNEEEREKKIEMHKAKDSTATSQSHMWTQLRRTLAGGYKLQTYERATSKTMGKIYLMSPTPTPEGNGEILILPCVPHKLLFALQHDILQDDFQKEFANSAGVAHNASNKGVQYWYGYNSTGNKEHDKYYRECKVDNGIYNLLHARAQNHHRIQHCSCLSDFSKSAISDFECMLNEMFLGIFPRMREDMIALQAKHNEEKSSVPLVGTLDPKIKMTNTRLEQAVSLEENDNGERTGYMTEGHHGFVEMVFGLMKTSREDPQTLHCDDKLALKRAEDLAAEGRLSEFSYRVGYMIVIPLSLEGSRLDYTIRRNPRQYEIVQKLICFGSALLIRMDIFHAGGYGSSNNWRVLGTILTPKTAYVDAGEYLNEEEMMVPKANGVQELIYRNSTHRMLAPMYDFNGERAMGNGNKQDLRLLEHYLGAYPSAYNLSTILHFRGFDGFWNNQEYQKKLRITNDTSDCDKIAVLLASKHRIVYQYNGTVPYIQERDFPGGDDRKSFEERKSEHKSTLIKLSNAVKLQRHQLLEKEFLDSIQNPEVLQLRKKAKFEKVTKDKHRRKQLPLHNKSKDDEENKDKTTPTNL